MKIMGNNHLILYHLRVLNPESDESDVDDSYDEF